MGSTKSIYFIKVLVILLIFKTTIPSAFSQKLLDNKQFYMTPKLTEGSGDSYYLLTEDIERNNFEKKIDSLFDKKRYHRIIEEIKKWNNNDAEKMNQHHLSNIGYAYSELSQSDSAIYYLKRSETKNNYAINDLHHALLGMNYYKIGLKNEGCCKKLPLFFGLVCNFSASN